MEIKIGVQHSPRELVVDSALSADEVEAAVQSAISGGVLSLTDNKGRKVIVPGDRLAYVEVTTSITGTVGFRS
ncbi:MAG TPA: DUF3107 domain-containing protein [Marmoricola sp.]|nr:DUF3107 domain-containing protein [Marmoricola sp.]